MSTEDIFADLPPDDIFADAGAGKKLKTKKKTEKKAKKKAAAVVAAAVEDPIEDPIEDLGLGAPEEIEEAAAKEDNPFSFKKFVRPESTPSSAGADSGAVPSELPSFSEEIGGVPAPAEDGEPAAAGVAKGKGEANPFSFGSFLKEDKVGCRGGKMPHSQARRLSAALAVMLARPPAMERAFEHAHVHICNHAPPPYLPCPKPGRCVVFQPHPHRGTRAHARFCPRSRYIGSPGFLQPPTSEPAVVITPLADLQFSSDSELSTDEEPLASSFGAPPPTADSLPDVGISAPSAGRPKRESIASRIKQRVELLQAQLAATENQMRLMKEERDMDRRVAAEDLEDARARASEMESQLRRANRKLAKVTEKLKNKESNEEIEAQALESMATAVEQNLQRAVARATKAEKELAILRAENQRLKQQQNLGPDALTQVRMAATQLDKAAVDAKAAMKWVLRTMAIGSLGNSGSLISAG